MAAPVFYIERSLFSTASDWKSNKSDSINKPQADFFEATETPEFDVMLLANGSLQAWGGALVSRKRGVPASGGKLLNWLAYRLKFRFPKATGANTARLETDLKICVKSRPSSTQQIRNVANFSTQWNADSGQFQIDLDPPGWVNTGFTVSNVLPDIWHTMEYRFTFDDVKLTFSVLSIQFDEQLFVIPPELQNVPMTLTNWEQVSSLQLQTEVYAPISTVLVEYSEGVLCWSDQRITQIPAAALLAEPEEEAFWWPRVRGIPQELVGGVFDPFSPGATSFERSVSPFDSRESLTSNPKKGK